MKKETGKEPGSNLLMNAKRKNRGGKWKIRDGLVNSSERAATTTGTHSSKTDRYTPLTTHLEILLHEEGEGNRISKQSTTTRVKYEPFGVRGEEIMRIRWELRPLQRIMNGRLHDTTNFVESTYTMLLIMTSHLTIGNYDILVWHCS